MGILFLCKWFTDLPSVTVTDVTFTDVTVHRRNVREARLCALRLSRSSTLITLRIVAVSSYLPMSNTVHIHLTVDEPQVDGYAPTLGYSPTVCQLFSVLTTYER